MCNVDSSVDYWFTYVEGVVTLTEKRLLEDIRHELASISKWYAFEPTQYINTEKEGHTIINNKDFLVQLDFEDLIKRIDKVLKE